MPFQIKDFVSIAAAEINHARAVTKKITDFQPGSVVRTLLEAPAVEIEELYMQMFLGLRDAIPVATFLSFGFEKLPAARAVGFVSISSDTPLEDPALIPAGAKFYTADGRTYEALREYVWEAGSSLITVQVGHVGVGQAGNALADTITSSDLFAAGSGYVVSNQAINTGREAETDAEREARFADFVRSLSRGTVTACLYAARSSAVLSADGTIAEYVTRVGIDEQPGRVRIYIYSSLGAPSAAILLDGQRRLDGWRDEETGAVVPGYRSAGVRVDLLPMVERSVPVSVLVSTLPGYSLDAQMRQRLTDIYAQAVAAVQPGTTLWLGTVVELMLAAPGVLSVVPVTNENIVCAVNEVLLAGEVTINPLAN